MHCRTIHYIHTAYHVHRPFNIPQSPRSPEPRTSKRSARLIYQLAPPTAFAARSFLNFFRHSLTHSHQHFLQHSLPTSSSSSRSLTFVSNSPPSVYGVRIRKIRSSPLTSKSADAAPAKFRRIETRQIAGSGKWIDPAAALLGPGPAYETNPLRHHPGLSISKPGQKKSR